MKFKKAVAGAVGAALVAAGAIAAVPAMADTPAYDSWIETDDPAPFEVAGGLVFYKAASINFGHKDGSGGLEPLLPLADLDGLAYTVADSSGYAPSYQIGVVNETTGVTYARLVWEPYMQSPALDGNKGVYTDLEDGVWWANRVFTNGVGSSPFGSGDGSQSKPQPLSFFENHFGPDTKVAFFGVKQGTTTEVASTVTSLTFLGDNVPLGDSGQQDEVTRLQDELAAAEAALVASQNQTATAKARIAYISGTRKVGHTVTAAVQGIPNSTRTYKWYVGGKLVKGANGPTLKLTKAHGGKKLSVEITTSWTDGAGAKHTYTYTAKFIRDAYIGR